jgi:lysozyme
MVDKRFEEYWTEAGKREYTRGAYHFFRSSKDPQKQADRFIATVKLRHKDLPPVLDIETMHAGCSKEELNRKALAWLQAVEKHYGRKPIVYTSDSFARDILSPDITAHYPMWIARYNKKEPRFADWTMWQFTEEAVVYGANGGYVDLSVIKQQP